MTRIKSQLGHWQIALHSSKETVETHEFHIIHQNEQLGILYSIQAHI